MASRLRIQAFLTSGSLLILSAILMKGSACTSSGVASTSFLVINLGFLTIRNGSKVVVAIVCDFLNCKSFSFLISCRKFVAFLRLSLVGDRVAGESSCGTDVSESWLRWWPEVCGDRPSFDDLLGIKSWTKPRCCLSSRPPLRRDSSRWTINGDGLLLANDSFMTSEL
jgi:hypothetical protein